MLYLYDNEISDDLERSFNPDHVPNPKVKVISPEGAINVVAQAQSDQLTFPTVILTREPDTPIDYDRTNFARLHRGVASVFDKVHNEYYYEKVLPVDLRYKLTILTTNTIDMDEIVKELLFKYTQMYFLTIRLPYESNRKVRFGVVIEPNAPIQRDSGTAEYLSAGTLYQTIIPLKVEGGVLVHYTPVKLKRLEFEVESDS